MDVSNSPDPRRLKRQVRRPLERSEEAAIEEDVADAATATAAERMEAAVALLDAAFSLMESHEENRDAGLCRFPGMRQERRRGLCRDGAMAVLSYVPYRTARNLQVLIEPTLENGERA